MPATHGSQLEDADIAEVPAAHVTHEVDVTALDTGDALPAAQAVQFGAALAAPNVPAAQGEQDEDAEVEDWPAGQLVQTEVEVAPTGAEYWPAAQWWQNGTPDDEPKVPAGQVEHADAPSGAWWPAGQTEQEVEFTPTTWFDAFPAGQSAQLDALAVSP